MWIKYIRRDKVEHVQQPTQVWARRHSRLKQQGGQVVCLSLSTPQHIAEL